MNPPLRPLAVTVLEGERGGFQWQLIERNKGSTWHPLESATVTQPTYRAAMAAGLYRLQSLVEDLDSGPRKTGSRPSAPEAPKAEPQAGATDTARPGAGGKLFGFGPLR
jgi:hypothetical protein